MRDIFFRAVARAFAMPGIFFAHVAGRLWISLKLPGLIRLPKLRHDLLAKSTFGNLTDIDADAEHVCSRG
jgi:hypothetical protein